MEEVCKNMPKVELHAHLNGSISGEILNKITGGSDSTHFSQHATSLSKCFELFAKIHEVVRTPAILLSVTREVIRDFARDNVIYLELRTTPKKIHEIESKDEYLESVLQGILEVKQELSIVVKLLISVDRKMGQVDGNENVDLAIKWSTRFPGLIVGLDLSGDPRKGSDEWIIPLLNRARVHGLRISCHLPEVINPVETKRILEFKPERVGHALYIHPSCGGSEEIWRIAKLANIPIETCISSNVIAGLTPTVADHYVKLIHEAEMPYVICTDDSGVFDTTLTKEYLKFLTVVPLDRKELQNLCLLSIDYCFASEVEKQELKRILLKWWEQH